MFTIDPRKVGVFRVLIWWRFIPELFLEIPSRFRLPREAMIVACLSYLFNYVAVRNSARYAIAMPTLEYVARVGLLSAAKSIADEGGYRSAVLNLAGRPELTLTFNDGNSYTMQVFVEGGELCYGTKKLPGVGDSIGHAQCQAIGKLFTCAYRSAFPQGVPDF